MRRSRGKIMASKIRVTYASRNGSTAGVEEVIGRTLAESGAEVVVLHMRAVKNIDSYSVVVAGSAVQGGQWLPEAMDFIKLNQKALLQKPFAAFLVCMTMSIPNEHYQYGVKNWLEPVRRLVKPVSEGFFAGALEIHRVPSLADRIKFRISVALGVWTEGDHRDWNAVRDWSKALPAQFSAV